jgi:hypothetical protein
MKVIAVLFVIALALFASCTKNSDSPQTAPGIKGTWNVMYLKRHSIVRDVSSVLGQTLDRTTEISYTTQNTQGTFVIDDSLISVVGLTYTVSSTAFIQQTLNDEDTSYQTPVVFTLQPTNSTARYLFSGSDSMFYPKGFPITNPDTTSLQKPSWGTFNLAGDSLVLVQFANTDPFVFPIIRDTTTIVLKK